ncbi:MAG: DegT/DnrJ/EryC1/StrS family aminotransferase, partial [Bacteroidaceae bacterium]|nr:DegT/DnrJ/EryC1/StrS family aminotransferase [Bacteroidaceae bacterium]
MTIPYLNLKAMTSLHADEIQQAIAQVVDSGWYLQGEAVHQFEQHYAQYIGTTHCIGVANGLDALTLTLRAYKELGLLHDGDEILVQANTFIATVLAITENRLPPVFVDVEPTTLDLQPEALEQAITPRTKALMLVHLYGRCTYNETLRTICEAHHLLLIEDNAQAHGCHYGQRKTGSLGHAACHSFYPGKNLGALGDGGAVTTNHDDLAQMIRSLANYGFSQKYVALLQGRNSRLDEIQAAVLDVKLRHLDAETQRRIDIARTYYKYIQNDAL